MRDDDNLEPNNDSEENLPTENMSEENDTEQNESMSKNLSRKKIQEKLSKSVTKNAAQKSLIKALLPILTWVLVFIIILIIIIGIVLFFITMPGMVIEQIKELAKDVGNTVASWFGEDTTKQVEKVDINKTLDYLEQMGYDLKGYGFLTKYLGEEEGNKDGDNDGVIRYESDEEIQEDERAGKIEEGTKEIGDIREAESDFVKSYLISDNYVYTIKNFNMTSNGWFLGALEHLASFFTGGQSNQYWSRGMINIWFDNGTIGQRDGYYSVYDLGSIKIDPEKKTMEIKRGWFNNAMTYKLDGWTGRYGMPIDFLLSVHVATMMPDLSYDMATGFETVIELYLHGLSGEGNTANAFYKSGQKYVSYVDILDIVSSKRGGVAGTLDALIVNSEEAMSVLKELGISSPENCTETPKCSDSDDTDTEACSECESFVEKLYSELKGVDDQDFKTYQPYIAKVTDHWYRDVYFVINEEDEVVENDYDYEALMKERWTLYETYTEDEVGDDKSKIGEYKLYEINDDGTYKEENGQPKLFDGTQEDAERENIKVVKRAKRSKIKDIAEDINWNEVQGSNAFSAYAGSGTTETGDYELAYPDLSQEDSEYEIKKKIYVKLSSAGSVKQTGEGQRVETNSKIKKMFLQNKYFRYDGSSETAEVIAELRKEITDKYNSENNKKLENYYGPVEGIASIDEEEVKVDFTDVKKKIDEKEEQVSDYSGTVSLNQDSLNAFSMLENEHTLDADYIYRDFKELIVELGYFKKEELTDETPRLLEFLVPDIGSYMYPERSIDKNENEYGTMIHSKGDIDANKKYKLQELIKQMEEEEGEPDSSGQEDEVVVNEFSSDVVSPDTASPDTTSPDTTSSDTVRGLGAMMGTGKNISISEVGAIDEVTRTVEEVSLDEFLETTREMCEYINEVGYDYCVYATDAGRVNASGKVQHCYHKQVHGNPCFLGKTFEISQQSVSKHNFCCATLISWALQNVGVMPDSAHLDGAEGLATWIQDNLDPEIIEIGEPLEAGDILCYDGHIDMVGMELGGGEFEKYNGGHYVIVGAQEYTGTSAIQKISGWPGGKIKFALRLNWGNRKKGERYEGYLGNEAVVSPVTGILLEYGTYDDKSVDSVSGEQYRVNVDLKYPSTVLNVNDETQTTTEPNANGQTQNQTTEPQTGETQVDKVGYAKILVLDSENYKKLENEMISHPGCRWGGGTFLNENGTYRDIDNLEVNQIKDKEKGWSDIDKTLYGYKEFAERYEEAGIAGYVVYIDGFKCELPDENFNNEDKSQLEHDTPQGKELEKESFKVTTIGNFNSNGQIDDKKELLDSLYEADEEYKLASERATKKLQAETYVKNESIPSFCFEDTTSDEEDKDIIVIKEGTVLGRTITDKELIVDYRGQNYYDFRKRFKNQGNEKDKIGQTGVETTTEEPEEKPDKIIGNYIRIIMRDLDKTVVENVEDYMKLDENVDESLGSIEKLMYWQAMEPEGFFYDLSPDGPKNLENKEHVCRRDNPSDKYGHDYAVCDGGVGELNLCPGIFLGRKGQAPTSIGQYFIEVTGKSPIIMYESWCTGEQMLDIYYKELMGEAEFLKNNLKNVELKEDKLYAMIDVAYAGTGILLNSHILDIIDDGQTPTMEQFVNTIRNTSYWDLNAKGCERRRMCDYYIYTEGKYGVGVYNKKDEIEEYYEFTSETPFQDLMRDINGAEKRTFNH